MRIIKIIPIYNKNDFDKVVNCLLRNDYECAFSSNVYKNNYKNIEIIDNIFSFGCLYHTAKEYNNQSLTEISVKDFLTKYRLEKLNNILNE